MKLQRTIFLAASLSCATQPSAPVAVCPPDCTDQRAPGAIRQSLEEACLRHQSRTASSFDPEIDCGRLASQHPVRATELWCSGEIHTPKSMLSSVTNSIQSPADAVTILEAMRACKGSPELRVALRIDNAMLDTAHTDRNAFDQPVNRDPAWAAVAATLWSFKHREKWPLTANMSARLYYPSIEPLAITDWLAHLDDGDLGTPHKPTELGIAHNTLLESWHSGWRPSIAAVERLTVACHAKDSASCTSITQQLNNLGPFKEHAEWQPPQAEH